MVNRRNVWLGVAVLCAVTFLCVVGCHRATKNTLHVTSVTPDAAVDVTGTLNGKAYELSVDRREVPLYVAYYEPINTRDVGKDFPAQFDEKSGQVIVQVPDKGAVRYYIQSVSEKN